MPGQLAEARAELRKARGELKSVSAKLRTAVAAEEEAGTRLARTGKELASVRAELAAARAELAETQRVSRRFGKDLRKTERELRATRRLFEAGGGDLPDRVEAAMRAVRAGRLTYLGVRSLSDLASVVLEFEEKGTPGVFLEAGTARGGSAIVMAVAKSPGRPLRVYDVFGMIPPPSAADGPDVQDRYRAIAAGEAKGPEGSAYYGYETDLLAQVTESFAALGVPVGENAVELVQGLFEDTLEVEEPVALAHLDGDWYTSTMVCLERIVPHLVVGGRLVVDDYDSWSGCRRAVDEFFAGRRGFRFDQRSRLHIVRES